MGLDDVGWGPEAASQSFPVGALLIRSGGKLAVAAETGQRVNASQVLVGEALTPASGVTDAEVRYARLRPGTKYAMQVVNASDTLIGADQATIGTSYAIRRISQTIGGKTVYTYAVDIGSTSNPYVKVVGVATYPGESPSTAGTEVYVEWVGGTIEG